MPLTTTTTKTKTRMATASATAIPTLSVAAACFSRVADHRRVPASVPQIPLVASCNEIHRDAVARNKGTPNNKLKRKMQHRRGRQRSFTTSRTRLHPPNTRSRIFLEHKAESPHHQQRRGNGNCDFGGCFSRGRSPSHHAPSIALGFFRVCVLPRWRKRRW